MKKRKANPKKDELVAFNVRGLTRDVRNTFKMKCIREDRSMGEAAASLIRAVASGKIDLNDV